MDLVMWLISNPSLGRLNLTECNLDLKNKMQPVLKESETQENTE